VALRQPGIEYIFSAVVILTEHLYFGRVLKSYGQGRAAEHQSPAGAKPYTLWASGKTE